MSKCLYGTRRQHFETSRKMIQLCIRQFVGIAIAKKDVCEEVSRGIQLPSLLSPDNREVSGLEKFRKLIFIHGIRVDSLGKLFKLLL